MTTAAVIERLATTTTLRAAPALGERLALLERFVRDDLVDFASELATVARGPRVVHAAAHHLLDIRGKHVRPLCVALASRCGTGFDDRARSLAVAVELVHSATLLHDDVVDVAPRRRGEPTAAVVYGNAASIFAGDWLLVAALRRIAATGCAGLLELMLEVIDDMIDAESRQLERRGQLGAHPPASLAGDRAEYFSIIEGKTAALFRWAMVAGARVGGVAISVERALDDYGRHLGVAFQAIDDELDFSEHNTGKDPLADIREGKLTFPLIVACERDRAIAPRLDELLGEPAGCDRDALAALSAAVRATGALATTRHLARDHVERGLAALERVPLGPARDALATVALASLERTS